MSLMKHIIQSALICLIIPAVYCVVVEIEGLGKVQGQLDPFTNTVTFTGLRYAMPPTMERRFSAPVPVEPWDGVIQANTMPVCPQAPNLMVPDPTNMTEDCLVLNIYTPANFAGRQLPVLVFIHGGAFILGSPYVGTNGSFMAMNDIVMVSIGYRLGVFGFLSHPALNESNFGFLDQRLALKWIKKHISSFGGDPNKITVMGDSAGAMSILAHLASPEWKDEPLFQRAIVMSPAMNLGFYTAEDSKHFGIEYARSVGCFDENPEDQLACLRRFAPDTLDVPVPPRLLFFHTIRSVGQFPVPDNVFQQVYADGYDRFSFKDVDILFGTTNNEGTIFAMNAFPIIQPSADLVRKMIDIAFTPLEKDAPKRIMELYPLEAFSDTNQFLAAIVGDLYFNCPQQSLLQAAVKQNPNGNYYGYVFNHTLGEKLGAFHGSDQHYAFQLHEQFASLSPNVTVNKQVAQIFGKWVINFIRNGKPDDDTVFPRYTEQKREMVVLQSVPSVQVEVSSTVKEKQCKYWHALPLTSKMIGVVTQRDPLEVEPITSHLVNRYVVRFLLRYSKTQLAVGVLSVLILVLALIVMVCRRCCRRTAPKKQKTA